MAKFTFKVEETHILEEDGSRIEIIGHRVNEGGGKGKFLKVVISDFGDLRLVNGRQYEAQWKKVGDGWTLKNIDPVLSPTDLDSRPTFEEVLNDDETPPTDSPRGTTRSASAIVGQALPLDSRPTYEEAKTKVLTAIGEFLDIIYLNYHLGQKR